VKSVARILFLKRAKGRKSVPMASPFHAVIRRSLKMDRRGRRASIIMTRAALHCHAHRPASAPAPGERAPNMRGTLKKLSNERLGIMLINIRHLRIIARVKQVTTIEYRLILNALKSLRQAVKEKRLFIFQITLSKINRF